MSADADSFKFFFTSGGILTATAVTVLCMVVCFFFSLLEYSAKYAGDLKHMSEDDEEKRHKAEKIQDNSEKYQNYAQIGFLINSGISVMFSSIGYIPYVKGMFVNTGLSGMPSDILSWTAVWLVVFLVTAVFCRYLPERLAFFDAENILAKYSGFFMAVSVIVSPMAHICSAVSGGIAKIYGHGKGGNAKEKTEEKILMMVDEGEENGSIEENTKSMIENVFDFDDTAVGEIMTHRKDVVAVEDNAKISEITRAAIKSGCSRISVYHDDIDNIVGTISSG